METVTTLQKKIVKALEVGKDPAPLLKELAELRAKIAAEGELAELQKIADQRQALRGKATRIQEKVRLQGETIDRFLKLRDEVINALLPILEKSKELTKLQQECYLNYHDSFGFGADMRQIPKGYLPADFSCPILEGKDGISDSYDRAAQGVFNISIGCGFLQSLTKGEMRVPEKPAGEFDGDLGTETRSCVICEHPEIESINKLLKEGKPLRDIEAEFGTSKSSLSRHKNDCLNLGAIRIRD